MDFFPSYFNENFYILILKVKLLPQGKNVHYHLLKKEETEGYWLMYGL